MIRWEKQIEYAAQLRRSVTGTLLHTSDLEGIRNVLDVNKQESSILMLVIMVDGKIMFMKDIRIC